MCNNKYSMQSVSSDGQNQWQCFYWLYQTKNAKTTDDDFGYIYIYSFFMLMIF